MRTLSVRDLAAFPADRRPVLRLVGAVTAFGIVTQLALLPCSHRWDLAVAAWLQAARPLFDRPVAFLTHAGDAGIVLPAAAMLAAVFLVINRDTGMRAVWLACGLAAGSVLAVALKHVIPHPGPTAEYFRPAAGRIVWRLDTPYGFPSGHTLRATLIGGAGLRKTPWLGAAVVAAMMIALIYSEGHWPSEVLGGLCLGWALLETPAVLRTLDRASR